jgi:cytochrome c oxidase subunit II
MHGAVKMAQENKNSTRRVLIASANPLFAAGLEKMLRERNTAQGAVLVQSASSMDATLALMRDWKPAVVIVDYDDHTIDRGKFLNHFVESNQPMQVMLVSLKTSGAVVVYDRKELSPAQAEDWLNLASL